MFGSQTQSIHARCSWIRPQPPPYEGRIAAGHFPYASGRQVPYKPKLTAPPFEMLYPALRHMFVRCFEDGHFNPKSRPNTQAWQWALEEAKNTLVNCWFNHQHVYSGHLQDCPWCKRTQLLGGRDPFPSIDSVRAGTHLAPAVAPARSSANPRAAPLHGSSNLPPPPVPRRVPVSSSKSQPGAQNPFAGFPGPRNDWAWIGLVCAVVALASLGFQVKGAAFLFGVLAITCGGAGEIVSRGWYLDGKGRMTARAALIAGLLAVALSIG